MPASKRSRPVALTKTEKRATRSHKAAWIQQVRQAVEQHDRLYVFRYENLRSALLKQIRQHFHQKASGSSLATTNTPTTATTTTTTPSSMTVQDHENDDQQKEEEDDDDDMEEEMNNDQLHNNNKPTGSRLMVGKNKLMQLALGRTPEEEVAENLRHVAKLLTGPDVAVLLTNEPAAQVEAYLQSLAEPDFARAGSTASQTVLITTDMLQELPAASMVEPLRKLGLPVDTQQGRLVLREASGTFRWCRLGEVLSANQCQVLKLLNLRLAVFRVTLVARWTRTSLAGGDFESLV